MAFIFFILYMTIILLTDTFILLCIFSIGGLGKKKKFSSCMAIGGFSLMWFLNKNVVLLG